MTASPNTPAGRRSLIARIVYAIPVIGWMLREVAEGDDIALLWFSLTLVVVAILVTVIFGLAGLVPLMLVFAAVALTMVLFVTFG